MVFWVVDIVFILDGSRWLLGVLGGCYGVCFRWF